MINLFGPRYSSRADVLTSTTEGFYLPAATSADSLDGNDSFTTSTSEINGFSIGGSFSTGNGHDLLSATVAGKVGAVGLLITSTTGAVKTTGAVNLDLNTAGNDTVLVTLSGTGEGIGLQNNGTFSAGDGRDRVIVATGNVPILDQPILNSTGSTGAVNGGTLDLGAGDDRAKFDAVGNGSLGLSNTNTGKVELGAGNDRLDASAFGESADQGRLILGIDNSGTISGGLGSDRVVGATLGNGAVSIYNRSGATIDMGALDNGSDVVAGDSTASVEAYDPSRLAIKNEGDILTGAGRDVVDALFGGFAGAGRVDLGADNDSLLGFGSGSFYGGLGRDMITLPEGQYSIKYISGLPSATSETAGYIEVTRATVPTETVMKLYDFEGIGGSAANAGLHFYDPAQGLLSGFTIGTVAGVSGSLVGSPSYGTAVPQ